MRQYTITNVNTEYAIKNAVPSVANCYVSLYLVTAISNLKVLANVTF